MPYANRKSNKAKKWNEQEEEEEENKLYLNTQGCDTQNLAMKDTTFPRNNIRNIHDRKSLNGLFEWRLYEVSKRINISKTL